MSKEAHISQLKTEVQFTRIEEQLKDKRVQTKIAQLEDKFIKEVCADIPNAFWARIICYFSIKSILLKIIYNNLDYYNDPQNIE